MYFLIALTTRGAAALTATKRTGASRDLDLIMTTSCVSQSDFEVHLLPSSMLALYRRAGLTLKSEVGRASTFAQAWRSSAIKTPISSDRSPDISDSALRWRRKATLPGATVRRNAHSTSHLSTIAPRLPCLTARTSPRSFEGLGVSANSTLSFSPSSSSSLTTRST